MKISRASAGVGTLALLLASAGVAVAAQDKPESLLPPGFDQPVAPAQPAAPRPAQPAAPIVRPPVSADVPPASLILPDLEPQPGPTPTGTPTPSAAVDLALYELPPFARRSLLRVGPATQASLGLPADSLGRADGQFLETLMRRLDAPLPSRWVSIALRRMLLSQLDTPRDVNGADFAAERAWLLLRMGEPVAARALVQSVDTDRYTPKMFQVAMQAQLANGDPAGVCAYADPARAALPERGWILAQAMCSALAGKPNEAGQRIDQARRQNVANGVDLLLAEKVVGAGADGRRAVTIEWQGVGELTAWRFGLAAATGETIPDTLYDGSSPQVRLWRALLPGLDPVTRAAGAELAAAQGVFSHRALVDLYGEIEESGDAGSAQVAVARDLRAAMTEADLQDRLKVLGQLWAEPKGARARYGRQILTARAASSIPVSGNVDAASQDQLIAAMLSAGLDSRAARWHGTVAAGSQGWALLALGYPNGRLVTRGDAQGYAGSVDTRRARMFVAGLAGLGRVSASDAEALAQSVDLRIGDQNPWTWAIDAAARRGEAATVVLLAGVGMQTRAWEGVPPEAIFHIVAALRAVGLEGYARMVAAEAITRL